jgi:hypothetical protein
MTTHRSSATRPRLLTCSECREPFRAPRIGRPPLRCSDRCRKAAGARWQRDYRRALVRDREELAAVRAVLQRAA